VPGWSARQSLSCGATSCSVSAINLQHACLPHRGELVKTLEADNGRVSFVCPEAGLGGQASGITNSLAARSVMKIAAMAPAQHDGRCGRYWDCVDHWTHNPLWRDQGHDSFTPATADAVPFWATIPIRSKRGLADGSPDGISGVLLLERKSDRRALA